MFQQRLKLKIKPLLSLNKISIWTENENKLSLITLIDLHQIAIEIIRVK